MQPTYLPWAGYFHLMASVDVFVVLDDVQFEKSSWQSRNRILVRGAPAWLTVPVKRQGLARHVGEVEVQDDEAWRKRHIQTLAQTYAQHPHVHAALEVIGPVLENGAVTLLAELNRRLIATLAAGLEISARVVRSSELGVTGARSERLVRICESLGCDEYLSPQGSREYLEADGDFARSGVRLAFQEYAPAPYAQRGAMEFVSSLSIVDVLCHLGWEQTSRYVRASGAGQTAREDWEAVDGTA